MKSSLCVGVVAVQHELCPLTFLRVKYPDLYEPRTAQVPFKMDLINAFLYLGVLGFPSICTLDCETLNTLHTLTSYISIFFRINCKL